MVRGRARSRRSYKKTNVIPITHTIVVGEALLEREPWIAQSLVNAFRQAQQVVEEAYLEPKYLSSFDAVLTLEKNRRNFGPTIYTHGLKSNRHIVETFVRYAHEQGYIKKPANVDALFAPIADD